VKNFGDNRVLDDVSFEVPDGSVCTLLGASGSGKTTTLRILAGLETLDAGEVWIGGQRMAGGGRVVPAEKREVGLVFQAYALWPHMKVFDQIAYPLRVRHMKKDAIGPAVADVARVVGLSHLTDRYPSQLSGGQQQRVALARALVYGPRLLLLDEPLSNLDAALRRQTRLELEQLQRRVEVTTIYVTHDQEEAMAVSDFVVVMADGKVVTIDTPRGIYDRPATVFVASFIGSSNLLHGKVADRGAEHVRVKLGDGTTIKGVSPHRLEPGDDAVVAVKPVDVTVREPGGEPGNAVRATVQSSTYVGDQVELVLSVQGQDFRASLSRWDEHAPGDQVDVVVPPELVTVLPPDA
jgi:iron(III) transport system ATP-binding protein